MNRQCELTFALDLSLISFHSIAVGFVILCFQCWTLVNLNAYMIVFYQNLRELSLLILSVDLGNSYILIAFVD